MTQFTGSMIFYNIMTVIRDDLKTALVNVPFKRFGIVPGAISWDECETCGQLSIATVRHYFSTDPPVEAVDRGDVSNPYLCADIVIQAIRCAPTMDANGNPPGMDDLDSSAQLVNNDAVTILCAVIDTLANLKANSSIMEYGVRQQMYVGPEGACTGSELVITAAVTR